MRSKTYIALCLFLLLTWSGCQISTGGKERDIIDSLNTRAYRFRYVDIDSTSQLAHRALSLSAHYLDGRNEALQHLAFVAYQQMDFAGVDSILRQSCLRNSNQLLLLCADVMKMKVAQRTGDGEGFFRAKNRAENRMTRIQEEQDALNERDMAIWVYAQTEFYIISSTYYFYQEQDSLAQVEIAKVLPCLDRHVDTAQWVYYNYMLGPGRLVEGENAEDVTLHEFDYLFRAYKLSHRLNMRYFEANSLQALASMFLTREALIADKRSEEYHTLLTRYQEGMEEEYDLSLSMCRQALALFQSYKDLFQTACTYRTLGEICFEHGDYTQALDNYAQALHCVNVHHLRYYGNISPDTLAAFNPEALHRSVEKEWIEDSRIQTVPEWIAGIRQQFSLTFSALDMKQASDYNRNFYLDLLQATNQNQELESRTAELQRQTRELHHRMLFCLALLLLSIVLFVLFRFRLKRRSTNSLKGIENLYLDFAQWNEAQKVALEEEMEEMDEQLGIGKRRITDNKRKNAESRAKVALVHAIVPFLDRIGGEVARMEQSGHMESERRAYIAELVDRIEEYNAILTEWIKMEQGQLNLHITTVSLARLFGIVAEGRYPFHQKGITLCVEPTDLFVKADESLTLFMINTLVDNARKFTSAGGTVTVTAQSIDDYVEVCVTDTGSGLSEKDVETLNTSKVYDAATIGGSKEGKGFGFGLMNCRGIIEKYKKTSSLFASAAFGVRSEYGKGSTFFFRLPRIVRMMVLLFCWPMLGYAGSENAYYDAVYQANVEGRYGDALYYAESVLDELNHFHPDLQPLLLLDVDNQHEPADMQWARVEVPVDYELITGLRNEISLAALALHDWPLYHYNNRICIRLHKFIHQDKTLPTYYHRLEQTHQNSNLLMVMMLLFAIVVLVMAYKLLLWRQVHLERNIEALTQYCSHLFDLARTSPQEQAFLEQTSRWPEMMEQAKVYQTQVLEHSVRPLNLLQASLSQKRDERARQEYETTRLYVQNQVLDNCLSTIKHESMYYPSRIRLLVENMQDKDIVQMAELVRYYHHIYILLCRQADAQVAQPGFRRQRISACEALHRAETIARRWGKKEKVSISLELSDLMDEDDFVLADDILLDVLFESLLQGMLHDGGAFVIEGRKDGRFVRFSLRDTTKQPTDEELANLFYPESHQISYLVAKQILREHDIYANHPGCRLVAQKCGEGYEIYFTLLKG